MQGRTVLASTAAGIAVALACSAFSSRSSASPMTFDFQVGGFSGGASLSGTFTGEDTNRDDVLRFDELSSFTLRFSGNDSAAAFSHALPNLAPDGAFLPTTGFEFRFDIASQELLSFSSCQQLIASTCDRPTAVRAVGQPDFGIDGDNAFGVGEEFVAADGGSVRVVVVAGGGTDTRAGSNVATPAVLTQTGGIIPGATSGRAASQAFGARYRRAGAGAVNVQSFDPEPAKGISSGEGSGLPLGFWVSLTRTDVESDFPTVAFDSNVFTYVGGADWMWRDRLLVGLALGYERVKTSTIFNRGSQASDSVSVVPYAGYLINDHLSVDVGVGYSDIDTEQSRAVGPLRFESDVGSKRRFATANVNTYHQLGRWLLSGTAGVLYLRERLESFSERVPGVDGLEIANPSTVVRIGQLSIGGNVAYQWGGWEPFVGAYYVHDYERTDIAVGAGQARPSDDDDEVRLSAGIRYFHEPHRLTAALELTTVRGRSDIDSESANLSLRWEF